MITIERYELVKTETVTNPNYNKDNELYLNVTPIVLSEFSKDGIYMCEIEYRVVVANDFKEDIYTALTLIYQVKGTFNNMFNNNLLLAEMSHIVEDAIDYHCYMINLDPERIRRNNNYN